jgi:hypothetical protein
MTGPRIVEFVKGSSARDSKVPIEEPLFRATPGRVMFEGFEARHKYEAHVSLKNVDSVTRSVRWVSETTCPPAMTIERSGGGTDAAAKKDRVAPGIEVRYTVRFEPATEDDVAGDMVFATDREVFAIPVVARSSARATLDLPHAIDFGRVTVGARASRPLLVRNVGRRAGRFAFAFDEAGAAAAFAASPPNGLLAVGESA